MIQKQIDIQFFDKDTNGNIHNNLSNGLILLAIVFMVVVGLVIKHENQYNELSKQYSKSLDSILDTNKTQYNLNLYDTLWRIKYLSSMDVDIKQSYIDNIYQMLINHNKFIDSTEDKYQQIVKQNHGHGKWADYLKTDSQQLLNNTIYQYVELYQKLNDFQIEATQEIKINEDDYKKFITRNHEKYQADKIFFLL